MAITFTDDGMVRFDSGWDWVKMLAVCFFTGVCMGSLLTCYRPALAHRLFILYPIVAIAAVLRLIKSLFVIPAAALN